ncbi:centromere protein I [Calliopsis andreniformis]|uniref:centromere protein I n=1 Tax=Calliopsis andreniformis TaxID=337506 RepID=UPI003FCDDA54
MEVEKETCIQLLHDLKETGKGYSKYKELLSSLNEYTKIEGLDEDDFNLLADIIITTNLGAMKLVPLVKCLIPRRRVPEQTFKSLTTWCLACINKLPITVSTIIIQWIIGLWEHQLIDKKVINIYYSVLFYVMLKKENLERHIARLIYVLTKPEDVTRKDVLRLLALQRRYARPQKHLVALLSLFKSYRPEFVPEKISSINIESAWKPTPEDLQIKLQNAKARLGAQTQGTQSKCINWNVTQFADKKKIAKPLLPSVRYFQIGSNIFKESDTMSIFNISTIEELGKTHLNVEMPCNAISLLGNTAGYHLLTFADIHYQSRFCHNLYNTLVQAFILENEKFSSEDKSKLLDMTIEFSRYMQQGILVVNHFFDIYFHLSIGNYKSKLLALLQWMTSMSISDLQEKVLVYVKNIFYESSIPVKCDIIKTLRIFITNLFVNRGFEECYEETHTLFLGEPPMDNLEDIVPFLTKISENLIISGLNIHAYDILLLSEALLFYEEMYVLESQSTIQSFTLAPPAVIYGGFVTRNCAILSRICKLLLKYNDMAEKLKKHKQKLFRMKMKTLVVYIQDIIRALWNDKPFSERSNAYFLRTLSNTVVKDLKHCNLDYLLNISNHYAILPYKCILRKRGLSINTKEDAMTVALYYYPILNEFLNYFG